MIARFQKCIETKPAVHVIYLFSQPYVVHIEMSNLPFPKGLMNVLKLALPCKVTARRKHEAQNGWDKGFVRETSS